MLRWLLLAVPTNRVTVVFSVSVGGWWEVRCSTVRCRLYAYPYLCLIFFVTYRKFLQFNPRLTSGSFNNRPSLFSFSSESANNLHYVHVSPRMDSGLNWYRMLPVAFSDSPGLRRHLHGYTSPPLPLYMNYEAIMKAVTKVNVGGQNVYESASKLLVCRMLQWLRWKYNNMRRLD